MSGHLCVRNYVVDLIVQHMHALEGHAEEGHVLSIMGERFVL